MKNKVLACIKKIKDFIFAHKEIVSISTAGLFVFVICSILYSHYFSIKPTDYNQLKNMRYSSEYKSHDSSEHKSDNTQMVLTNWEATTQVANAGNSQTTSKISDVATPASNGLTQATYAYEDPLTEQELSVHSDTKEANDVVYIETAIGDATRIVLDPTEDDPKDASKTNETKVTNKTNETKETNETNQSKEKEETSENPVGSFRVKSDVKLLNMRETPDNNGKIIVKLTDISRGKVLSYNDAWAHVKTTNYEGYVATQFIIITEYE